MLDNAALDDCTAEAGGTVSLYSADVGWVDVLFDGRASATDPIDVTLCDGCGAAWSAGDYLGQVCVDFSELVPDESRSCLP